MKFTELYIGIVLSPAGKILRIFPAAPIGGRALHARPCFIPRK